MASVSPREGCGHLSLWRTLQFGGFADVSAIADAAIVAVAVTVAVAVIVADAVSALVAARASQPSPSLPSQSLSPLHWSLLLGMLCGNTRPR